MPDTVRGNLKDKNCSDCGEKGCEFQHWGPMVPKGEFGSFCGFCWTERSEAYDRGEGPKPLGIQPPGISENLLDKRLRVATESGSVYELNPTKIPNERIIFCNRRKLHFTKARVICLRIGENLFLKPRDGSDFDLCWTSSVVLIEVN